MVILNKEKYHRRSLRLKGYDYSQPGTYFITICTKNRECLLGEIKNGKIILNEFGEIAKSEWIKSSIIRKEIKLDEFMIMPNHIHGIIIIDHGTPIVVVGANGCSPLRDFRMESKSISSFVAGYKSSVTKQINILRKLPKISLWQRNYYEHIIRNETELNILREYIVNNPLKWDEDEENPNRIN
jgi:REP element-mobilizing transposase RayT